MEVEPESAEDRASVQLKRDHDMWVLSCRGVKQHEIARRFGIAQGTVSTAINRYRATLPPLDLAKEREEAYEMLRNLQAGALEIFDLAAAPVVAGKDGDIVYDPETHEVVRDHAGRLAALLAGVRVNKEIRVLLGLDAATKVESDTTVRYVLEGVDTTDLS